MRRKDGRLSVSLAYAAVLHDDGINACDIVMGITSQYLLDTTVIVYAPISFHWGFSSIVTLFVLPSWIFPDGSGWLMWLRHDDQ